MKNKLQKLNDQHDGNILVIHPEVKDFIKYNKLSKENSFPMEMTFNDLEKISYKNIITWLAIHGSNNLTFESFLNELEKAEFYNVLYIVFHETTLLNIFNEYNLDVIKWYNINILVENTSLDIEKFNESYNFLKTKIIWLKKCIDLWHANLHNSNINDWFDKNVLTAHIHNNYWKKDSHYSLWRGTIDYSKLKNKLKSIKYISLETDVSFETYKKNIFFIQNIIYDLLLNSEIQQKIFIKELKKILNQEFYREIEYCFIYGSFVSKTLTKKSDVDILIVLKKIVDLNWFREKYFKLIRKFNIKLDEIYPFEVFESSLLNMKNISYYDKSEIIYSHLCKNKLILWDIKKFNSNIKKIEKYLNINNVDKKLEKNKLKNKIKRKFLSKILKDEFNIISERYLRYYINLYLEDNIYSNEKEFYDNILNIINFILNKDFKLSNKIIDVNLRRELNEKFSEKVIFMPIFQTQSFLNPHKHIRQIKLNNENYVLLKVNKPETYLKNIDILEKIVDKNIVITKPDYIFNIQWVVFFLIKSLWITLEDWLKDNIFVKSEIDNIINLSTIFQELITKNWYIFWWFAPRNFFYNKGKLFIIDFEKLYNIKKLNLWEMEYFYSFQKIWFSDVFNQKEINRIIWFNNNNNNNKLVSDYFEQVYFGKENITLAERNNLLKVTKIIERKVIFNWVPIYWHAIGQFISDNFSPEIECRIVKSIEKIYFKDRYFFALIMNLLDYIVDYLHELSFSKDILKLDDSFLILFCNLIDLCEKDILFFIYYISYTLYLDKNILLEDKRKILLDIFSIKMNFIKKGDINSVKEVNFWNKKYIIKISYWKLLNENKNNKLIEKYFDFTSNLLFEKTIESTTYMIFNYLWESTNAKNESYCAKILAKLHTKSIKWKYIKLLKTKNYFDFNKNYIKHISKELSFYIKNFEEKKFKIIVKKLWDLVKKDLCKSLIHNDLHFQQFYSSNKTFLIDWNFLWYWNPIIDIASILKNDYDNYNDYDKEKFIKYYLKYMWLDYLKLEELIYWFNLNSYRDIWWYLDRITNDKTQNWNVILWLNDSYNELINNNFFEFYNNELLKKYFR